MDSNFDLVYENYASKFSRGGFLPGDFVKFKANVFEHPSIKAGSEAYRDKIKELMESDLNIRLQGLTNIANKSAGAVGSADRYDASIYQTLPGNSATSTDSLLTVPLSVLEWVASSTSEAQAPVPKSFKENCEDVSSNYKTIEFLDDTYDKGGSVKNKDLPESDNEELEEDSDAFTNKNQVKEDHNYDDEDEDYDDFEVFDDLKLVIRDIKYGGVFVDDMSDYPPDIDDAASKWAAELGWGVRRTNGPGDYSVQITRDEHDTPIEFATYVTYPIED